MSKNSLIGSCEVTLNTVLKRLSNIDGENKKALHSEFKEWISAIENDKKNYDILYLNKIS